MIERLGRWSFSFVYTLHYLIFVCLHITLPDYHYTDCLKVLIAKILIVYILSSVCLRLIQFFQLSVMQYMGLCVFGLPISVMMIVYFTSISSANLKYDLFAIV